MMSRGLCLALVLLLASSTQASLHTFMITGPSDGNEISIVGSPDFELSDTPQANGFQYDAITPMTIKVVDHVGDVTLDLLWVSTRDDHVTMVFQDQDVPNPHLLRLVFDSPGVLEGDPIPSMFSDDEASWNLPEHLAPSSSVTLAGMQGAKVIAVPEPSAMALSASAFGILGIGRVVRRRLIARQ